MWRCETCGTINKAEGEACTGCGARPASAVRSRKIEADEIAISAPGVDTGISFEDIDLGQGELDVDGLIDGLEAGGDEIKLDIGEAEKPAGDIAIAGEIKKITAKRPAGDRSGQVAVKDKANEVKTDAAKDAVAAEMPVKQASAKEAPGNGKSPDTTGGRARQPEKTGGRPRRIWLPIVVIIIAAAGIAAAFLALGGSDEGSGRQEAQAPGEAVSTGVTTAVPEDMPVSAPVMGQVGGGIGNISIAASPEATIAAATPEATAEPYTSKEPDASADNADTGAEDIFGVIYGSMTDGSEEDIHAEEAPAQTAVAAFLPTAEPVDEQTKQYYEAGLGCLAAGDRDTALYSFMQAEGYEDSEVYARSIMLESAGSIATGLSHTLWTDDGVVSVNGNNFYGQCDVSAWPGNILQVAAGKYHSVGLDADGRLWFAGDSYYGQCTDRGWQNVEAVAAGGFHTVALMQDGSVAAVGQDIYGQCAVGSWSGAVQVAAGERHTAALLDDGRVVAAGDNTYGQLNVSGWTGVVQIACGPFHTVALRSDGTVLAAGLNDEGQCDVQSVTGAVYVAAGDGFTVCVLEDGSVIDIAASAGDRVHGGWRYVLAMSAGGGHTVGVFPDGSLMLSGSYFTPLEKGAKVKGDI